MNMFINDKKITQQKLILFAQQTKNLEALLQNLWALQSMCEEKGQAIFQQVSQRSFKKWTQVVLTNDDAMDPVIYLWCNRGSLAARLHQR